MLELSDADGPMRAQADALYLSAFPPGERIPPHILYESCGRPGIRYRCLSDADGFAGITYTVETDDILYIVYLAIDGSRRSGGLGGAALRVLMEESGKRTFLNIEPVSDDAPNPEQRVRRRDFYMRNGFREHGLLEAPDGNTFMVMVAGGDFTDAEILDVYDQCGLQDMMSADARRRS